MPKILKICRKCHKNFEIDRWRLKNPNRGQFCSILCTRSYFSGKNNFNFGSNKTGENNPSYKGSGVGYVGLHEWVYKMLGKPDKCETCGKDHLFGKHIDWANKDHKYRRVLTDWLRLCRSCHRKYDYQLRINNYVAI